MPTCPTKHIENLDFDMKIRNTKQDTGTAESTNKERRNYNYFDILFFNSPFLFYFQCPWLGVKCSICCSTLH